MIPKYNLGVGISSKKSIKDPVPVIEDAPTFPRTQTEVKPYFKILNEEQAATGALNLPGSDHQVPASINRFLREYQRDGVRFFHSHYLKNEGG